MTPYTALIEQLDEAIAEERTKFRTGVRLELDLPALRQACVEAERYTWLRAQPPCDFHKEGWQIRRHWKARDGEIRGLKYGLDMTCLYEDSLDAAIDSAIEECAAKVEKKEER